MDLELDFKDVPEGLILEDAAKQIDAHSWAFQALEYGYNILLRNAYGWVGVGYSCIPPAPEQGDQATSFMVMRGNGNFDFFAKKLIAAQKLIPLIRYYAALGTASTLQQEVYRVKHPNGLIIAAQCLLRRPQIVEKTKASALTMRMISDICNGVKR
jgi:hypothetical protein